MASSTPTPLDHSANEDRRVYPRVPVALPAFLQSDGIRHHVQLLDISAGGAKLDCPVDLPLGVSVFLDCGVVARAAVVRWKNAGVVGMRFERELGESELAALAGRSEALAVRMQSQK